MIQLILPVPPTANNLFPTNKQGKRFPSSKYKAWMREAARAVGPRKFEELEGRLRAEYRFSFPDKRKRDVANFEKAVTDFLQKQGLFKDDSQIDEMRLIRCAPGQGIVCITIESLDTLGRIL